MSEWPEGTRRRTHARLRRTVRARAGATQHCESGRAGTHAPLIDKVRALGQFEAPEEGVPVGDSQSAGDVENVVERMEISVCTGKKTDRSCKGDSRRRLK